MELEQIQKMIETLNFNIDSQTAIDITEKLMPVLWVKTVENIIFDLIGIILVVCLLVLIFMMVRIMNKDV